MGLALRRSRPDLHIDAVEPHPAYRQHIVDHAMFDAVYAAMEAVTDPYDLIVLATPPYAACALLPWAASRAKRVMDVASVKSPICDAARTSRIERFVPSHPMAGKASGGPAAADADLFHGRPWIFLESHPAPAEIADLVTSLGARLQYLENAEAHDRLLASLSHGIHLASLSAMLAASAESAEIGAAMAGPAFWDITRLAGSPSGFWVDTLLANREHVLNMLDRLGRSIDQFRTCLDHADADGLRALLDEAREKRQAFEEKRPE